MAATMTARMVAMLIPGAVELKSTGRVAGGRLHPGLLVSTNSKVSSCQRRR